LGEVNAMRFLSNTILLALLVGCAHQPSKVVALAREAVFAREPKEWAERATYRVERRDGNWAVMVWSKPSYPGDFRIITVGTNGDFIKYYVGNR